jgi:hypothetical protein
MDKIKFNGLQIGQVIKNNKTLKNWIVTEFITSYSSVKKSQPDQYKVRLSNGMGKFIVVPVDSLRKKYKW